MSGTRGGRGLRVRSLAAPFLLAGVLAACAQPPGPLGIPAEEWRTLSADQQALAEAKDAELAQARVRDRRDAAEEAGRFARIAENYASGHLGDVIYCTLGPGKVGSEPFDAVEVLLAREQHKTLGLIPDSEAAVWLAFAPSGISLRLCRTDTPPSEDLPCTAVAAPYGLWAAGHRWEVAIAPDLLTAPLACRYAVAGEG